MPATRGLSGIPVTWDFGISDRDYEGLGKSIPTPGFDACPLCDGSLPLKRHGFYSRFALARGGTRRLLVLRLLCPHCGRTFGVLPVWAIPGRQVTWFVLWQFLVARLVEGRTLFSALLSARGGSVPIWHRQAQQWLLWCRSWWPRLASALAEVRAPGTQSWCGDLARDCLSLAGRTGDCPLLEATLAWRALLVARGDRRLWAPPLGLPEPPSHRS